MKTLTLTQPWATLVAVGAKLVETRSWSTTYRGPLAIHAAKAWRGEDIDFAGELQRRGILPVADDRSVWSLQPYPRGMVVATCLLADVVRTEDIAAITDLERELGDYSAGRFAWLLEAVEQLTPPIPARGALGLWEWPRCACRIGRRP